MAVHDGFRHEWLSALAEIRLGLLYSDVKVRVPTSNFVWKPLVYFDHPRGELAGYAAFRERNPNVEGEIRLRYCFQNDSSLRHFVEVKWRMKEDDYLIEKKVHGNNLEQHYHPCTPQLDKEFIEITETLFQMGGIDVLAQG